MPDGYPTTADVRTEFVSLGARLSYVQREDAFDRWYRAARNDARVDALEDAAREAVYDAEHCECGTTECRDANLVTAEWLRGRAESIRTSSGSEGQS